MYQITINSELNCSYLNQFHQMYWEDLMTCICERHMDPAVTEVIGFWLLCRLLMSAEWP